MNNYCNIDEVKNRFSPNELIQLTDDNRTGEVNDDVITREIFLANSLINGYLGKSFVLPMSVIPPLINVIAIDLSIYNLYIRRLRMDVPDSIKEIYKNCVNSLKEIQKGNISLGLETKANSSLSSVARRASFSVSSRKRVFGENFLNHL